MLKIKRNFLRVVFIIIFSIVVPSVVTLISRDDNKQYVDKKPEDKKYVIMEYESGRVKLTAEEFLIFVMMKELSLDSNVSKEFLKAKCVMDRTLIYKSIGEEEEIDSKYINLSYLTQQNIVEQFGEDYVESKELVEEIIESTKDEKMYYKEELVEPLYHELSNGYTRDGSDLYDYLICVECKEDMQNSEFKINTVFNKEELKQKLGSDSIVILNKCDKGYVNKIKVGDKIMSGETFKEVLKLNSTAFDIVEKNENIEIITKGKGNGFGMSLNMAKVKASQGENYKDILKYFYKNIDIRN